MSEWFVIYTSCSPKQLNQTMVYAEISVKVKNMMKDGKCSIESLFAIKMYAHFAQLSHSIFSKTAISRETTSVWWMKQSIKTGTMDIAQKFQLSLIVENFGLCKYVSRSTHISTT